MNCSIKVLL